MNRKKTSADRASIAAMTVSAPQAARHLASAMTQIYTGINDAAAYAGRLEADFSNTNGIETLASPRADKTYQLFGALTAAYNDLADHLNGLGRPE